MMHGQGGKGAWGRLHGAINHDPFPSNLRKHERIGQPTRAQLANVLKLPVIFRCRDSCHACDRGRLEATAAA